MLWHAVQLIWATLVKISFTDLLPCADNTCLLDASLHRIIISIHFPLIYAIWWALLRCNISVWMEDRDARFPLPHTQKCAWRLNEDKHTNNIPRTTLRVTSWAFHLSKSVSYPHIIYTQRCKGITATRQNKSLFFFLRQCSRNMCSAECTYYYYYYYYY